MNEILEQKIKNLPTKSGVYVMKDVDENVIYVGKAKNLKNRVSQYFQKKNVSDGYSFKVKTMVEKIFDLEYFITLSELDALALESNLIKKHQPFYNILLKDGKAFPYIKIDVKSDFPKVEVVRKVKKDNAKYFGPYFAGISAYEIVKVINNAFPIRTCKLKINPQKPQKRECLNFMLGLCSAPCTNRITSVEYKKIINKIIDFLNGDEKNIEQLLHNKMLAEAEKENFEKAIEIKNQIAMIQKLKQKVIAMVPPKEEIDVFAYVTNNISGAINQLSIRGGKILAVNNITTFDASLDESETLSSFIIQYYENAKLPSKIIISHDFDNKNEISKIISPNKKIDITKPERGYKKQLLDMSLQNAKDYLEKSIISSKNKYNKTIGALHNLQNKLNLKRLPKRIECYDISNTQGTNSVASMVVFINGEKAKKHYRKFKIKTVEGPNDFASLSEVLTRRINNLESNDESFSQKPDLIIIDGGKGQLSSTYEILKNKKIEIDIMSLAEKFDEVFLPNNPMPIMLKRDSVELHLIQNIRDEAHRFAITFHRKLRNKKMIES